MADLAQVINYRPPPIAKAFIKKYLPGEIFYNWIVGPFGSAKTTAMFFKLVYMAQLQEKSPDGIRYSRAVVVRNTFPQLRDNTLVSWNYWFKDGVAGEWEAAKNTFTLRWGDVQCEVLFRALDTPADVARVLGLEVTFALIDEFREIPRAIIESLQGRLGRFKPDGDVGCTNWGMWGASNPGTEDVWWYDYLHATPDEESGAIGCIPIEFPKDPEAQKAAQALKGLPPDDATVVDVDGNISHINNAWYYHQPSGLAVDAENIENLPGKRGYYSNLAKGKSRAWVKQYIEAEWGFSAAGQPVISSFNPDIHIAKECLKYDPRLQLVIGMDPGLGGSSCIFFQREWTGRVNVLGELVQRGMGARRIITERVQPYVNVRFPRAKILIAPDPAAAIRANSDEQTSARIIRQFYPIAIETNNRLPLRINAIDHFLNTNVNGQPAMQIDPVHCPTVIRALKGGWRYSMDVKKDDIKGTEPEKNWFSHTGDGFGYGCRYFHKGVEAQARYAATPLPRQDFRGANSYHVR
jgi:hypothetical protein